MVYAGGGGMLANLAGRFGLDRFELILRAYAHDHRNGVTDAASFRTTIDRAAARYLPGFDTHTRSGTAGGPRGSQLDPGAVAA
ncbi:MAG: hypothetical protein ABJB55_03215 [Actinomycetota bacterium]